MEIKTTFAVGDLVKYRYSSNGKNDVQALEVLEVQSQTCYAGTQVFYSCRVVFLLKEYADKWSEKGEFSWAVRNGISKDENQLGWQKFREDELIFLSQEYVDIIKSSTP